MVMKQQTKLISGSLEKDVAHVAMQNEISELQKQLGELSLGFEYLASANVELSRDMQLIYESLKNISSIVNGDDSYSLFQKYGKYHDDDLPN
tara:strand:- start:199 stop:474 length:276 start_codon:yes stop_codon:yes gene_type:complete